MSKVAVIIPALNEEQAIGRVIDDIPPELRQSVIVVDNGSTDRTPQVAAEHGAKVVHEPQRGYGAACLAGMAALEGPDIVVFLDGDHSDYPEEMPQLVDPIARGEADMVIGSRMMGRREKGALPPHSLFGNWLAAAMLRALFGQRATDLGPFRALSYQCLRALDMRDRGYGWTAEMQAKAARDGWRTTEVPVSYRRRIGKSKITGSLLASLKAGYKIIT
ncbi:MAG: glycosyltransferase family 2 protein, partial [Armatimonadota bacterium]